MTDSRNRFRLPIPVTRGVHDSPVDVRDARPGEPVTALRPPEGAPNVLVILIDDMGFGASSAYGGPCRMPNAERLAADGAKFTRFHTTALCSPTRQALLTGRNHQSVDMGVIAEVATSAPGYTGIRPDTCATIAQILRMNGYSTGAFGKMHQTPPWETSPSGPFDRWPTGDGFEKFYGFLGGDCSQWSPPLYDGVTPIDPPRTAEEGYHLTEDLVDQVIGWTGTLEALTSDKPWLTYLAFGATHAPHHVPKDFIDACRGQFDRGYDRQRDITIEKQKQLGVIPADAELTTPNSYIQPWDQQTDDDHLVSTRLMEAYAGFATHTDFHVGRPLDELEERGTLDNTLVLYMLGDNGASAEAGQYGTFNEMAYQNNVLMTTADFIDRIDEVGSRAYQHDPAAGNDEAEREHGAQRQEHVIHRHRDLHRARGSRRGCAHRPRRSIRRVVPVFKQGVPACAHNWVGLQTMTVRADMPIASGDHVLEMRFDYDGGGAGKGGVITLTCDGQPVRSGRIEKTVPALFSFDDGMDIGIDKGEPVVADYATPQGAFTGTIKSVVIDIAPDAQHDVGLTMRAKLSRQ